jgi:hypothetical protein
VWSKDDPDIEQAAQFKGVHIVSFDWVVDSCILFQRMEESDYRVSGVLSPTQGTQEIEPLPPDKDLSSECTFETSSEIPSSQSSSHTEDEDEEEEDPEPDRQLTIGSGS